MTGVGAWDFIWVSHKRGRDSSTLVIFCYFTKHINVEPDQKQSSWDSKLALSGISDWVRE